MLSWTLHLDGAPETYCNRAVAHGCQVYSFGRDTNLHVVVYVFNMVSLRWRKLSPEMPGTGPPRRQVFSPRWDFTAVLIEDTVYLWGGWGYCNVLHAFDVDAHRWFKPQVSGIVPEERVYHSACVSGKAMYVHGGYTQHTGYTNQTYKLDTATMVWSLNNIRGTPPPASEKHYATFIGTKMFVFGGFLGSQNRMFDTESNHWLNTTSAQILPRFNSAFTYNGELYVFGDQMNDLWKFSPETLSCKKVEPKGKVPASAMSILWCCMVGDRAILVGGGGDKSTDLYVLDFSPSLKTLCKLAVIQHGLEQSELTHDIKWELRAMSSNNE